MTIKGGTNATSPAQKPPSTIAHFPIDDFHVLSSASNQTAAIKNRIGNTGNAYSDTLAEEACKISSMTTTANFRYTEKSEALRSAPGRNQ